MNMRELCQLVEKRRRRKRVGRGDGSGHGKTSGRGHKGARARTGATRRHFAEGGQMPLYRRLPKKGFSNARFRVRYDVINVGDWKGVEPGAVVDLEVLKAKGILKPRTGRLKVLGDGEISVPLEVRAAKFSETAKDKILKAGGKVEVG